MRTQTIIPLTTILGLCAGHSLCVGAVSPVNSPGELGGATTISFEGYAHNTVANTLFLDQGVEFARDDGQAVFVMDWTVLGRTTTSPDNVLATITVPPVTSRYVTHLNVLFSTPLLAVGAYFGNDQTLDPGHYESTRLSIYDESDVLLGSIEIAVNFNTSVDQFIGLSSDAPFSRIRFDNLDAVGEQSPDYSVVLDDLIFTPIPEPSTFALFSLGSLALLMAPKCSHVRNVSGSKVSRMV